ncbi:MAG: hypothetical protein ABFD62_08140 [Syntrophaceae bacterium]
MRPNKILSVVVAAVIFLLGFVPQAEAWHVTVYNPTEYEVLVGLYVVINIYGELDVVEVPIPARSNHTFKTGAKCPFALTGTIRGHVIRPTCLGPQKENVSSVHSCWPNCFNSEWAILKHSDDDWHFCVGDYTGIDMNGESQSE